MGLSTDETLHRSWQVLGRPGASRHRLLGVSGAAEHGGGAVGAGGHVAQGDQGKGGVVT